LSLARGKKICLDLSGCVIYVILSLFVLLTMYTGNTGIKSRFYSCYMLI
jgi:hypothetical protein